jgi:hypothetical protein
MTAQRRRTAIVSIGVVVVGMAVLAWDHGSWVNLLGFNRERNRQSILDAYARLRIGMTAHQAGAAVSRLSSAGFRVYGTCGGSDACVVSAPLEVGARNWMLYLQFESDRLSSARIRTEDSAYERPEQAPPDLGRWREAPKGAAAQQ